MMRSTLCVLSVAVFSWLIGCGGGSSQGISEDAPDAVEVVDGDAVGVDVPDGGPSCGDDMCNGEEDCASCAEDCGECPQDVPDLKEVEEEAPPDVKPVCGDGKCNGEEDCASCEEDCGVCPVDGVELDAEEIPPDVVPVCGNGVVEGEEQCDDGNTDSGDGCSTDCLVEVGPVNPGDLIVTEIMLIPPVPNAEWIELYNTTANPLNLEGWVLRDDGDDAHLLDAANGKLVVEPYGFLVMGGIADPEQNGGVAVDYQWQSFKLDDVQDQVVLMAGEVEVDRVDYSAATFPLVAWVSLSLDPQWMTGTGNDDGMHWCPAPGGFGTPGETNQSCSNPPVCGNGVIEGDEECDDGNKAGGDGCNGNCKIELPPAVCGNGELEQGEECDDGNKVSGDGCSDICKNESPPPVCGNGKVEANEMCDDGNLVACDGCDGSCKTEPLGILCGDGCVEGAEECDDGNLVDGDGCSSACKKEGGTPNAGKVVITEIMKDPKMTGDQTGEWFELLNVSNGTLDLNGWILKDLTGEQHLITNGGPLSIAAGQYLVFGVNGIPGQNGGVTVSYVYKGISFVNKGDDLILLDAQGAVVDQVHYDETSYPNVPGKALSLDPGSLTAAANDVAANWCEAVTLMAGGDFGTPGAANPVCPAEELCGNGKVDPGEQCDDGNKIPGDGCSATCTTEGLAICGNGKLEVGEDCDDGNLINGDGCSALCKWDVVAVCGNGKLESGEECDDGNLSTGDGCSDLCTKEGVCGNGIIEPGEKCDDGNLVDDDGCSSECLVEFFDPLCGDGKKEGTEQCDDGNLTDGDGCSSDCSMEGFIPLQCGNEVVEPENDEQCDDGNTQDGDGCDHFCKIEGSGLCKPSPCCGDGWTQAGEECDDGNLKDDDGCSSTCKYEMNKTGIAGTVKYTGAVAPADKLYVLAFDKAMTDPKGVKDPVNVVIVDQPSFPYSYTIGLDPGTYWIGAVLDLGGNGSEGFQAEDPGAAYPTSVVIPEKGQVISGIDMTLTGTGPVTGGSVSGTVSYAGTVTAADAVVVVISKTKPPQIQMVKSLKKFPAVFPWSYLITGVPAGQYYVSAILDKGNNNPQAPGAEDITSAYGGVSNPKLVTVTNDTETKNINVTLEPKP